MVTHSFEAEIAVAAALFALVLSFGIAFRRQSANRWQNRKLLRRLGYRSPVSHAESEAAARRARALRFTARNEPFPMLHELGRILAQAGMRVRASTFAFVMLATFISAALLASIRLDIIAATAVGVAAAFVPLVYVRFVRNRRMRSFNAQVPYLLDLLKSALESGHALLRGLQMASTNLPEPIAGEVRVMLEQVQVGMTLPQALESLYERIPEEDIGFLVAAIRVQSSIGSSLAEIIEHVSQSVRNRQRLESQMRTLTAQSRASAAIVSALPLVVLAVFTLIRPDYARPLFYHPVGIRMLELAIVLDVTAFLIMRRIARVEY